MRKASTMNKMFRSAASSAALFGALALLSACGDDAGEVDDAAVDETAAVSGEVLEGSISDEMLPLDELQSRAPQAVIVPEDEDRNTGGAATIEAPDEAADDAGSDAAAPAEPVLDLPQEPAPPAED